MRPYRDARKPVAGRSPQRSRLTPVVTVLAAATLVTGCGSKPARTATAAPTGTPTIGSSQRPPTTTAPTTAPPPVRYPGHLLLAGTDGTVYKLATGSSIVKIGKAAHDDRLSELSPQRPELSPDGKYALDTRNETLTTVATGTVAHLSYAADIASVISYSPDQTKLVYTTGSKGTVVVYNIATGTSAVVLRTPCADYTETNLSTNARSTVTLCGQARGAVWLGPDQLFVYWFTGDLPQSPSTNGTIWADTFSITTAFGQLVTNVTIPDPGGSPVATAGDTVVFDNGKWVMAAALRSGKATLQSVTGVEEPSDGLNVISPDGTMMVVGGGHTWSVVNTATGAVRALGTPTVAPTRGWSDPNYDSVAWSPDGRWFAVQMVTTPGDPPGDVLVVPVSATAQGAVVQGTSGTWLAGWVS